MKQRISLAHSPPYSLCCFSFLFSFKSNKADQGLCPPAATDVKTFTSVFTLLLSWLIPFTDLKGHMSVGQEAFHLCVCVCVCVCVCDLVSSHIDLLY